MARTPKPDQKPKLIPIEAVFVTDELHFETEYLILRLTDALRLVEKRRALIQSTLGCIKNVVQDDAQMGLLRKECALFDIRVDPDKEKARVELEQQLAELKEQCKELKAVLSAVKAAAKSSRMFTSADFEKVPPDAVDAVLASLQGKTIRFEHIGSGHFEESIETSDPRVVAALVCRRIGRPVVVG